MSKKQAILYGLSWAVWGELALWGCTHNWQLHTFLEFQWLWILAGVPMALLIWWIVS